MSIIDSAPSALIARVKKLGQDVAGLYNDVAARLAKKPDPTKRVPFEGSIALAFATGDFSQKTATLVNGGDDLWLQRFGCAVQMCRPLPYPVPLGLGFRPVPYDGVLTPLPSGFYANNQIQPGLGGVAGNVRLSPVPLFDFRWNWQLASTQASYGSTANTVSLLSRASLGNAETLEGLTLDPPGLLLRAGDTLTFYVQPTLFPLPGLDPDTAIWPYDGNTSFIVNLTAVGYRDGFMAEAAYER